MGIDEILSAIDEQEGVKILIQKRALYPRDWICKIYKMTGPGSKYQLITGMAEGKHPIQVVYSAYLQHRDGMYESPGVIRQWKEDK